MERLPSRLVRHIIAYLDSRHSAMFGASEKVRPCICASPQLSVSSITMQSPLHHHPTAQADASNTVDAVRLRLHREGPPQRPTARGTGAGRDDSLWVPASGPAKPEGWIGVVPAFGQLMDAQTSREFHRRGPLHHPLCPSVSSVPCLSRTTIRPQ